MFDKRLMQMCPESRRFIAGNIVLQWLELMMNAVMIGMIAQIVEELWKKTLTPSSLILRLLIISVSVLIRWFTTKGAVRMSYLASRTVKRVMREQIYEKLLRLGVSYREHSSTAELVQESVEGVEQLETYFGQYMPQFFYAFLAPITLFFLFGFAGGWKVGTVLLICVPLIPGAIMVVQKIAKKLLSKYWAQYTQLGSTFLENLQGMTTLKTYQADAWKNEQMNQESEHFRVVTMKVLTMQLNSIIIMDFIAIVVETIMCLFIGSWHWAYGLLALCAWLGIGVVLPVVISWHSNTLGDDLRAQSGNLAAHMLESIRGIDETQQYHGGSKRLREITEKTNALSEKQGILSRLTGTNLALANTLILVFDMAMLILSALFYTRGLVGFDGFLIPVIAFISSFGPVTALAALGTTLQNTVASGARILAIIDEEPETKEVVGKEAIHFQGASAKRVSFSYGGERVLQNLSLHISQKQVIGIVGKSGCGKSTLLKLWMRFWKTQEGTLAISDRRVEEINTEDLRKMESYMTQETQLFQDTIANNVRIGKLDASQEEIEEACKKASIHSFIMALPKGYETQVGELGDTLSGGEKQRIGLARAFLHDAPFMLLDEPTSSLDSLNEAIVLKSLHESARDKTILLVSHRLSTMRIADQVLDMKGGRIT